MTGGQVGPPCRRLGVNHSRDGRPWIAGKKIQPRTLKLVAESLGTIPEFPWRLAHPPCAALFYAEPDIQSRGAPPPVRLPWQSSAALRFCTRPYSPRQPLRTSFFRVRCSHPLIRSQRRDSFKKGEKSFGETLCRIAADCDRCNRFQINGLPGRRFRPPLPLRSRDRFFERKCRRPTYYL